MPLNTPASPDRYRPSHPSSTTAQSVLWIRCLPSSRLYCSRTRLSIASSRRVVATSHQSKPRLNSVAADEQFAVGSLSDNLSYRAEPSRCLVSSRGCPAQRKALLTWRRLLRYQSRNPEVPKRDT